MVLCTVFHRLLISVTRGRKKHKDNSEQSNTVSFPGTGRSLFGKCCAPSVRKLREKRACQVQGLVRALPRMGNSGGLFNNVFQPFHCIFPLYQIEEVGRDQRLGEVVFQKWPLLLGALQEMSRSGQCPALPQLPMATKVMAMAAEH